MKKATTLQLGWAIADDFLLHAAKCHPNREFLKLIASGCFYPSSLCTMSSCSSFSDTMGPCISWKHLALGLCAPQALCKPFLLSDLLYWPKGILHGLLHSGWAVPWMGELPFVQTALVLHAQLSHGIYHFSQEWLFLCSLPFRQWAPWRGRSIQDP